jgi:hypothetical protein
MERRAQTPLIIDHGQHDKALAQTWLLGKINYPF